MSCRRSHVGPTMWPGMAMVGCHMVPAGASPLLGHTAVLPSLELGLVLTRTQGAKVATITLQSYIAIIAFGSN